MGEDQHMLANGRGHPLRYVPILWRGGQHGHVGHPATNDRVRGTATAAPHRNRATAGVDVAKRSDVAILAKGNTLAPF